jgi:phage terminase large subunit GpA-like protein
VVYRFCERLRNTYPVKGFADLVADPKKGEVSDVPRAGSFKKYRVAAIGQAGERVVEISTYLYKDMLYGNLKIERLTQNPQRPGFCDFPIDYDEEYFAQLTGEEKLEKGGYRQARNRVEALDCRVYNLCAGHFYLDLKLMELKAEYKKAGMSGMNVMRITAKTVIDRLAAAVTKQTTTARERLQKVDCQKVD